MRKNRFLSRTRQRGAATLLVAVMLLFSLTLLTLFSARSSVTEQQIAGNENRARQALEAAQAGLEQAVANTAVTPATLAALDNDGDGLIRNAAALSGTLGTSGVRYSASYSNLSGDNFQRLRVTATGFSDDNTANRTVSQALQFLPLLPATPTAAITALGNVNLGGNVTVTNLFTHSAIRAGGTVTLGGSAGTATGNGSSGIQQNDAGLSSTSGDQFFQSVFGDARANFQAAATPINCAGTGCNGALSGQEGKILWVTPSSGSEVHINGNTVIGSEQNPVILIINGDFRLNGGATIWGIVYVIGDWDNSGGGNAGIQGATLIEGSFRSTGTPSPNYNPDVLSTLNNRFGNFAKVAGTWRDFE